MAILVAPGTDVTIINETFFIPAQATTVPVIFGVTAEQKVLEDGTTVAVGTTTANKIRAITNITQSRTIYGTPRFYRDENGNPLHGDCRNEYGLATLNYVLGITALAYFIRADVNTDDTRANLLTIWDRLVNQAVNKIEADAIAKLNAINLAAGVTIGNPAYRVSLTKTEVTPIVQNALNTIVHVFYSFREKTVANGLVAVNDPVDVVWTNATGYPANTYVFYNNKFYKSTGTTLTTNIPGSASVWQLVEINWKNTKKVFQDDRRTRSFDIYDGPAGFLGLPNTTDRFIGVEGYIQDWNDGQTPSLAVEFTPLELKTLVIDAADAFVLTKEFGRTVSLGADDSSRRTAVVTALQKAVLNVPELYGESITYTMIIAPGFPELVDDLDLLYTNTKSENSVFADGPMNMDPSDYTVWANANSASGLTLPSNRTLPADYPSRLRGDHYYYYGCGVITNIDGQEIVVPASTIALRTMCYSDLISYPWFAPAGIPNGLVTGVSRIGYLRGELGTATEFVDAPLTDGDRIQFALSKINAIPFIDGSGYVIFSQTTSAAVDSELASINIDRGVKYIKRGIRKNSKVFLFKPNDQRTRDQFKAFVDAFLSELVTLRCLFDFATLCDDSNNTSERVAKKELWCDVAIQPITAVEFIYVPITVKKPS